MDMPAACHMWIDIEFYAGHIDSCTSVGCVC